MTKLLLFEVIVFLAISSNIPSSAGFSTASVKSRSELSRASSVSASTLDEHEVASPPPKMAFSIPFTEMTRMILDENERFEFETEDIGDSILPLLIWWGKKESAKGARTVESLLNRIETQNNDVLNNKHYTVAIDAWGKAPVDDSVERAERVLKKMRSKEIAPTRITYNVLMNAYARKGKIKRVQEIINLMENDDEVNPITSDYNVVLSAYARLGMARKAEEVLKGMIDKCIEPDLCSYNILLDAWSRTDEKGRGQRAEEILKALESRFEAGELPYRPDARTYTMVISAVVRSEEDNSIQRAEQILRKAEEKGAASDAYVYSALLDAYANNNTPESALRAEELLHRLENQGMANEVTYNTVLKVWQYSDDPNAVDCAEAILEEMENRGLADTITYSTIISIYAKRGGMFAAERAEELLKRMESTGAFPNTYTFNSVMNALVRNGEFTRAEQILERMEKSFYSRRGSVVPNVVSYTTLMNGWAKSNSAHSAKKTREWFGKMKSMYKSGNKEARPNAISYVTLITSIAKSGEQGAAAEAERLLLDMFDEYKRGNEDVKPNTQLVCAVMDSWQKSGDRDAGERAEALLDLLIGAYEQDGDEDLIPNEFAFTAAISAWARSRKFGKARRAKAILTRMVQMNVSGQIPAKPNTHCYTAVINSCAFTENDALEKREAIQIAVETYKELCASGHDKPNHITFSTMITALRNLLPASDKRTSALQKIFNQCKEEGEVTEAVLYRLQSALSPEEFKDMVGSNLVSKDRLINMGQVPHEWRLNTGNDSQR